MPNGDPTLSRFAGDEAGIGLTVILAAPHTCD